MKSHVVVLSNESQWNRFQSARLDVSSYRVFCDNARFYEWLSARGIEFEVLDEYLLENEWRFVNEWGCEKAAALILWQRDRKIFTACDFPMIIYHLFSRQLAQMIKNYRYAKHIVETAKPEHLIVFRALKRRDFPDFSGNYYLNEFLKRFARSHSIKFEELDVFETEVMQGTLPAKRSYRSALKNRAKSIFQGVYASLSRRQNDVEILAHGSMAHLGSVIAELKKRGEKVGIYDFEFHSEIFEQARKLKIPYLIPGTFKEQNNGSSADFVSQCRHEITKLFQSIAGQRIFDYDGFDFTSFIQENIFSAFGPYLEKLSCQSRIYPNILRALPLKALLVDEDYAQRGSFLASFYQSRGVPVFCASHANLAVDFSAPTSHQVFQQSITFVNSEYEKKMYSAKGWNFNFIHVTGTPRYDRMLQIYRANPKPRNHPFKLLYLGTGLWGHSPDQRGFLGSKIRLYGASQRPALRTILRVIGNYPLELIIKPHSDLQGPFFKEFIKSESPAIKVTIVSHQTDIFKLYHECDAMILSYWSTALFETAICGLPTIFVDLTPLYSQGLYEFARQGFCQVVNSDSELQDMMEKLVHHRGALTMPAGRSETEYYLGRRDTESTTRVVDYILKASGRATSSPPLPSRILSAAGART